MVLTEANCYRMLGLDSAAPLDEVRRAYRRLARMLHPDRHQGDQERFKEITAAYNVLTGRQPAARSEAPRPAPRAQAEEPVNHEAAWAAWRRRAADARVAEAEPEAAPADPPPAAPPPAAEPVARVEEPQRGGWFERLRDRVRRAGGVAAVDPLGQDVTLRLPLDLAAVLHGCTDHIAITRAAACPRCRKGGEAQCLCGGTGRVKVREKVRVVVPPGARPGTRLRLAGKGTAGLAGAPDGDLYLLLEPEEIPGFRRDGADLHGTLVVAGHTARQGGAVKVEAPVGPLRLVVPRGTRTGDRFRLKSQGLPGWAGAGAGDLYLTVEVR